MATPLELLPDLEFAAKDPTAIANGIITGFEAASAAAGFPITLAPGDKRRLFLLFIASAFTVERGIIDFTGKQNRLKYAGGAFLEALGAFWGPNGLKPTASPAFVTLQFTRPGSIGAVVVPLGTQAAAGGLIFATMADLTIPDGATFASVNAQSQQNGIAYNGLVPGQINTLVTWSQSFAVIVTNTDTSQGGADEPTDDQFRELVFLAPLSLAVAGTEGQYLFWARRFSNSIIDAQVWSKEETSGLLADGGRVEISVLLTGGAIPGSTFLSSLLAYFTRKIRPLTDFPECIAPVQDTYNETITFYISTENGANAVNIQAAVLAAIIAWENEIATHLGWDINPSELYQAIRNAGAKRAVITSPAFTVVASGHVGKLGTKSVTYMGLEDN